MPAGRCRILATVVILSAATAGCASDHRANPNAPDRLGGAPPAAVTVTGTVTATNGGQALPGLAVDLAGQTRVTDAVGWFSYQVVPGTSARLALSGGSIVPRSVWVAVGPTRHIAVDAIGTAGFDLNFYRQLVRNGLEATTLEPLRRWTMNPSLLLQTSTLVDAGTLDMVERTVRDAVRQWTNGRYAVATVERGPTTRENQAGWLTVRWSAVSDGRCGFATVGLEGGWIELHPTLPSCGCGGYAIRPTVVRHEVGHAMGFQHTDSPSDVMVASASVCDKPIAPRELAAAAIAYTRPVGNTDPDSDPLGAVTLAPTGVVP